jgi:hypothetical protein
MSLKSSCVGNVIPTFIWEVMVWKKCLWEVMVWKKCLWEVSRIRCSLKGRAFMRALVAS